ncbi:uncharacterized protein LOC111376680 [Olea europaea var. sylvestris]|uniref:uncharacterized protein LOC111376680 n=1 Tax=Olea europaea var. sylvestris TaxID=158386 RepID=UPI000C1D60A9|nr:uncharacterized protein LOC111376680 [Olea europaea var. sylvestris]
MASSITRRLLLRSIYGAITAQCRLTKPSFHRLPESTRPFKPEFGLDNVYRRSPNFAAINYRFLCTTSNQSNSNATGSSEGNSGKSNDGESSDDMEWGHWSRDPKSWTDIFYLLCFGAGLVCFFICANNQQIEG